MNKKILALVLGLPCFLLMCWVLRLGYIQKTGRDVVVSISGYDPRDLLSGRYISYIIDWEETDCAQFEEKKCPNTPFCKENRFGQTCRFYVPEKDAAVLDELFALQSTNGLRFEVVYVVKKGFTPIAKELLIDGLPWREFLKVSAKKS